MSTIVLMIAIWIQESSPPSGFILVTSPRTQLTEIHLRQLRQIFLKKRDRIGKQRVTPIHLKPQHQARQAFEEAIFHTNFSSQRYWQQQRIQGGESPPLTVASEAVMLVYVARNPGFIGYVSASLRSQLADLDVVVLEISQ